MSLRGVSTMTVDGAPWGGGVCVMRSDSPVRWHQPVMAEEVLRYLNPRPGAVMVDGTLGTGGHSQLLLPRILPDGRLVAMDRDPEALRIARQRLVEFEPQVTALHDDYRRLPEILRGREAAGVDGVLLDLGMSSLQVERSERGFSFSREGPLDMRMDPRQTLTARQMVNTLAVDELADVLQRYGQERHARRIAQRIAQARRERPIETTTQLARVVVGALPPRARHGRLHAATRTFQALRIAVNDELGALASFLASVADTLNPGGRAVVLTYHSLEDRLVKQAFAQGAREGWWRLLTKKPLGPGAAEVARNPRARSAKLRAVERLP